MEKVICSKACIMCKGDCDHSEEHIFTEKCKLMCSTKGEYCKCELVNKE